MTRQLALAFAASERPEAQFARKRLMQRADGYEATYVAGVAIQRNGVDTGARPGRVVRSH